MTAKSRVARKEQSMAQEGQWRLVYGYHNGTEESKDWRNISGLASLEACRMKITEIENNLKKIRYYIWFATAIGPDGQKVQVHDRTWYKKS